jgi:uncharacterized protein YycO
MMRYCLALLMLVAPLSASPQAKQPAVTNPYELKEGDIVFQSTAGPQAKAIADATGSPYTHCGVVIEAEGQLLVLEAVQPVRVTPIQSWIARSSSGIFHARRLIRPVDPANRDKVSKWIHQQTGKNYDLRFAWSDTELYCSELVWKLYQQAGVELCKPQAFRDYNLQAPSVQAMIKQRYGSIANLPLSEPVVAPSDIAESKLLAEVPKRQK